MTTKQEKVTGFRNIVELVIEQKARRIERRPAVTASTISYKKMARLSGLIFASLDSNDVRFNAFGFSSEHMWGVTTGRTRKLNHEAHMAVTSTSDQDDTLIRRWVIYGGNGISTEAVLETEERLDDALLWASSPLLQHGAYRRLGELGLGEVAKIQSALDTQEQIHEYFAGHHELLDEAEHEARRDSIHIHNL